MSTPAWLKAAADSAEASALLYSRLLVAREVGPVYGHGALPDWVKAANPANTPAPPDRINPIVDEASPSPVGPPALEGGLSVATSKLPDSSALAGIGSGAGRGLGLGGLAGAGLGLAYGLSKKDKKTPVRSALLGGLAGGALGATAGGLAGSGLVGGGLAHLYSRVKGAQAPPPATPTPAPEPPKPSFLQRTEDAIRGPLEKQVKGTTLAKKLPVSNSHPGDPLGALGNSIRPALIGTAIGGGLGLASGLTSKKKRPFSGLLLGGLAGGLAGGAGGYLYDRVAGKPSGGNPTPEDIQGASDDIRRQAPGEANEFSAGLGSKTTWAPEELDPLKDKLSGSLGTGAAVGAGIGAATGTAGQAVVNKATKGSRTTPTNTHSTTIPHVVGPDGKLKPIVGARGTVTGTAAQTVAGPTTSALSRGGQLAWRGGLAGAVTGPAITMFGHVKGHGAKALDTTNPAQAVEGFKTLTAYSDKIPPPPVKPGDQNSANEAARIIAARQQLLLEVKQRQAQLAEMAQKGQTLNAAERALNLQLHDKLNTAGMIPIQPVGTPARR